MRYSFVVVVAFLFVACASTSGDPYKKMNKLVGLWQLNTNKGLIYEEWWVNKTGSLSGKTYMLKGADSTIFERVELVKNDSGIYYIPAVKDQNGGKPTPFKMISSTDSSFTFENKLHDFPKRIIYRFVNDDSLVARIEGEINGATGGENYFYRRIKK